MRFIATSSDSVLASEIALVEVFNLSTCFPLLLLFTCFVNISSSLLHFWSLFPWASLASTTVYPFNWHTLHQILFPVTWRVHFKPSFWMWLKISDYLLLGTIFKAKGFTFHGYVDDCTIAHASYHKYTLVKTPKKQLKSDVAWAARLIFTRNWNRLSHETGT